LRSDWVISGFGHAALILVGLVSLASSKPVMNVADYVPITVVTAADLSQAALGEKNAPKPAAPKPLADKVGESKPVDQLAPTVADKPPITTAATAPTPQPKPKPQKKKDDFRVDKIADLLKKSDPPKKPDKPAPPKYDARQIAQLLDHRAPQRQVATAGAVNSTPSLGAETAAPNAQLSQSEIDALRERIRDCWSPPPGIDSNSNIYVSLRVLFKPDGSLAQMPVLIAGSASALGPALAESATRALLMCQPFTMLKPEHYAQWKDITMDFDPRDLSN
jgi:outer membrane biosynthesis protein TonB